MSMKATDNGNLVVSDTMLDTRNRITGEDTGLVWMGGQDGTHRWRHAITPADARWMAARLLLAAEAVEKSLPHNQD